MTNKEENQQSSNINFKLKLKKKYEWSYGTPGAMENQEFMLKLEQEMFDKFLWCDPPEPRKIKMLTGRNGLDLINELLAEEYKKKK